MSIVNFISSWLKDIVVLFLLISISELIMPKGNMKKYIDLTIGLLIIFTIISPLTKVLKKDFDLGKTVFNYSKDGNFINMDSSDFENEQEKQIEELYKDKIKTEITEIVEEKNIYKVVDINIEILKDSEIYGEIEDMEIIIDENNLEVTNNKISIEKVKPIDIDKKVDEKDDTITEENQYAELKDLISKEYLIEKDKITIVRYKKRNGE